MYNDILCVCGINLKEKDFKNHYKKCKSFINKFKKFDYKIAKLLEEILMDKDNLYIVRYLFKRYLKLLNKKIKEYEKENNKAYNNKEEALKNLIKNNKDLLFGNTQENESSCFQDVLSSNLKYIMKDEELEDCTENFKNFVRIDTFKDNSEEMAPKPVQNDISAPTFTNNTTPTPIPDNQNEIPKGDSYEDQTPDPNENLDLISKPGFEQECKNYFKNSINIPNNENKDTTNNKNEEKGENNNINNNDINNNNNNNNFIDYFADFGKNYFSSFFNGNYKGPFS